MRLLSRRNDAVLVLNIFLTEFNSGGTLTSTKVWNSSSFWLQLVSFNIVFVHFTKPQNFVLFRPIGVFIFGLRVHKYTRNSLGDEIANVNFFTTTSYMYNIIQNLGFNLSEGWFTKIYHGKIRLAVEFKNNTNT